MISSRISKHPKSQGANHYKLLLSSQTHIYILNITLNPRGDFNIPKVTRRLEYFHLMKRCSHKN